MLSRLAILLVSLALLGAACSDSPTTTTAPDSTVATTSDPDASIVFGSGSVPETMPAGFPIPAEAVIGSTLIDRDRARTEMIVRVSAELEVLTAFYDTNLTGRNFTVDSSGAVGPAWEIEFSSADGTGTIGITSVGEGVSQAVVTFSSGS